MARNTYNKLPPQHGNISGFACRFFFHIPATYLMDCMWTVCGRYVDGMWTCSVCGRYVAGMWPVCGRYVACMWICFAYGRYVAGMWPVCGRYVEVFCMWPVCGRQNHLLRRAEKVEHCLSMFGVRAEFGPWSFQSSRHTCGKTLPAWLIEFVCPLCLMGTWACQDFYRLVLAQIY